MQATILKGGKGRLFTLCLPTPPSFLASLSEIILLLPRIKMQFEADFLNGGKRVTSSDRCWWRMWDVMFGMILVFSMEESNWINWKKRWIYFYNNVVRKIYSFREYMKIILMFEICVKITLFSLLAKIFSVAYNVKLMS